MAFVSLTTSAEIWFSPGWAATRPVEAHRNADAAGDVDAYGDSALSNVPDTVFASPEPSFELTRVDGACVVAAGGELDLYAAPELERALMRAREQSRSVVLDLSRVTFIDSTALGQLLAFDRRLAGAGGSFALVVRGAEVARALELTRLDRILRALPSREEAVRAVTSWGVR